VVHSAPCPTCGQPAALAGPHSPFCALRCKQVDLYRWLTGDVALEKVEEPLPPPPPEPEPEDEAPPEED
jgi:hypothetical protein